MASRRSLKLSEAIQGYMLRCESKKLSHRTQEWYSQKLTSFSTYMEEQQKIILLKDVTLWHLRSFAVAVQNSKIGTITLQPRKQEKTSDLTVKGYVQVLKTFFNWCVSEGLIKESPAAKLENPQVPKYIMPTFEETQIKALFDSCDVKTILGYRDYTIMFLLLDTGIRLSEIAGLTLDSIHKNFIKVFGKGSKEREVGVHPETAQHLWRYVTKFRNAHDENERHVFLNRYGKPLTDSGIGQAIADIGKRAGVSTNVRVSPHTFRHTFAKMYLDNGGDLFKLSRSLGHSEISTTEEYLKDFKSRDARKGHEQYSPVGRLKKTKKKPKKQSDSMFS